MLSFLHQTTNEDWKDSGEQTSSALAKLLSSSGAEHKPVSRTVAPPGIRDSNEEGWKCEKPRVGQGSAGRFYPELVAFEAITWGNAKTLLNLSFPSPPPVWALKRHLKKSLAPQSFPIIHLFIVQNIYTVTAAVWPLCLAWRICSSAWSLGNMLMLSLVFPRCSLGLLPRCYKARRLPGPPSTWAPRA